jgi:hypothetical protein
MHVYTMKKNAVRAARRLGLTEAAVKSGHGGFFVVRRQPAKSKRAAAEEQPREGTKNRKLLDLMARPGGATMAELLKATGWKRCTGTMRDVARDYGYTITRHPGADGAPARWEASR